MQKYKPGEVENLFFKEIAINNQYYLEVLIDRLYGDRKINKVIHTHPKLELSIVKQGKGKYYIGDKVYPMEAGDIFIINNIEPHGIELDHKDTMVNMVLHFEPRFVWAKNDDFDSRYLKIFFDRNGNFSHKLDNNNAATQKMRGLFQDIENEFMEQQLEYNLMVKVKLLNMLVLLLRHYGYVKDEESHEHIHELKIINMVINYIHSHYHHEIKLKDLADIAHMNPAYFSTFFKKYNGISPSEYIVRNRVTRAIDYLRATDKSILEISGLCGFNNSANFNKMFKKITGTTPSAFRE